MSVAVGLRVIDLERDKLALGVIEDVGVLVAVMDDVGLTLSLDVLVFDGVPELLGVAEALAPIERDADGVPVIDDVRDVVDEDVCDAVPDLVAVSDPVGVPEAVMEAVALPVSVALDETVGVTDDDGDSLADAPRESVVVGVPEAEDETLVVVERLSLREDVCDGVMAAVPVPEPVPLPVIVGVTLGLRVVDAVSEFEPVDDGLTPDESVDVGVKVGEGDSEIVVDGVLEDVDVGDSDDVGVPDAL